MTEAALPQQEGRSVTRTKPRSRRRFRLRPRQSRRWGQESRAREGRRWEGRPWKRQASRGVRDRLQGSRRLRDLAATPRSPTGRKAQAPAGPRGAATRYTPPPPRQRAGGSSIAPWARLYPAGEPDGHRTAGFLPPCKDPHLEASSEKSPRRTAMPARTRAMTSAIFPIEYGASPKTQRPSWPWTIAR